MQLSKQNNKCPAEIREGLKQCHREWRSVNAGGLTPEGSQRTHNEKACLPKTEWELGTQMSERVPGVGMGVGRLGNQVTSLAGLRWGPEAHTAAKLTGSPGPGHR